MVAEYLYDDVASTFGLTRSYVHCNQYIDERAVLRDHTDEGQDFYYLLDELYSVAGLAKSNGNLVERFRKHGDAYFRFITTPGIEPTNNLAEQAIRFVVIDRHITQGTRSETGRQWCERIWTVMATCTQQGRSVLEYLENAVHAYFNEQPTPSLLPAKL